MAEWKPHRYGNGATVELGHGLMLSVAWESIHRVPPGEPAYNVTVFSRRLKKRCASLHEGKVHAMRVAKVALEELQETLRRVEAATLTTDPKEHEHGLSEKA
jgi:hypothetical protein